VQYFWLRVYKLSTANRCCLQVKYSATAAQVKDLLERRWASAGVTLPDQQLLPEVIATLIRMTGGNFRLLARLLTQIERVLRVNDLHLVSNAVVEAARER
jgi:hypothetical protein